MIYEEDATFWSNGILELTNKLINIDSWSSFYLLILITIFYLIFSGFSLTIIIIDITIIIVPIRW